MAVKKTTTTKSSAKKTATKPAAKKATTKKVAVKPAVKKTSTVKSAAKKTTTKSTSTTTSTGLSVSGNKKIGTLQKEFNKKFPYLRLGIYYSYARDQVKKGETITQIPEDKTLASVRRADSGGTVSISGNKRIKSIEQEMDKTFGLYCQICYTTKEGNRYYTSGSADEKTLSAFNAECEKNGCKKGVYR